MRAYKQRLLMRLANSTEATQPRSLPTRAVKDVAAMQPSIGGSMCSPGILPDQLCADSCFAFYNPISSPELEHYVNSWLENLVEDRSSIQLNFPKVDANGRVVPDEFEDSVAISGYIRNKARADLEIEKILISKGLYPVSD